MEKSFPDRSISVANCEMRITMGILTLFQRPLETEISILQLDLRSSYACSKFDSVDVLRTCGLLRILEMLKALSFLLSTEYIPFDIPPTSQALALVVTWNFPRKVPSHPCVHFLMVRSRWSRLTVSTEINPLLDTPCSVDWDEGLFCHSL